VYRKLALRAYAASCPDERFRGRCFGAVRTGYGARSRTSDPLGAKHVHKGRSISKWTKADCPAKEIRLRGESTVTPALGAYHGNLGDASTI